MSIAKIERELKRVREKKQEYEKREALLEQELSLAEDAVKKAILDKNQISVEELKQLIREKKQENKRLLHQAEENLYEE